MDRTPFVAFAAVILVACSSQPPPNDGALDITDSAADVAIPDSRESGALDSSETAADGTVESGVDAGAEASADVVTDARDIDVDTGADVLGDDATDIAMDTGTDVIVDTGVDVPPACVDTDLDTYGTGCGPGPDCDDTNNAVHPGAIEACGDSVDNNCDGRIDEGCPCPVLTVTCPTGCCAVPAIGLAPVGSYPSVAIDPQGYIYVAYSIVRTTTWGEGIAIYNPTTSVWTATEMGTGGYSSRVIVSATGRVHHLFGGNHYAFVYRYSDDHGLGWTTRTVSSTSGIGGTSDMAIGAGDVPHIVYQDATTSVWPALKYSVGGAPGTTLDTATTSDDHPSISLGFADRPHIFASAYHPDGVNTTSVRHVFYDGARWVFENVEMGAAYGVASDYNTVVRSEVFADDSVRVSYTRRESGGLQEFVIADRTPGTAGTWTNRSVPGVTAPFQNPQYVDDVAGAAAVVANGLSVYRPNAAGTFVAPAPTLLGTEPAYAVSGRSLLVAYRSNEASTRGQLYFTRFAF